MSQEPCSACAGRGKINFGMTVCPKCRGKQPKASTVPASETQPATKVDGKKKTGIRTGLAVQLASGEEMSQEDRKELDDALGLSSNTVHEYSEENGICSCGLQHTPAEARYRVQEALNKLKETNPRLAESIIPVPINMADGPLGDAIKKAKSIIIQAAQEWRADNSVEIPLEIFAACAESCSEAWIKDCKSTPGFTYPTDFDDRMRLETNGLDTIHSVLTALFLANTPCEACSPSLRTLLGVLAQRIRGNRFLAESAGLVPGSSDGDSSGTQ